MAHFLTQPCQLWIVCFDYRTNVGIGSELVGGVEEGIDQTCSRRRLFAMNEDGKLFDVRLGGRTYLERKFRTHGQVR